MSKEVKANYSEAEIAVLTAGYTGTSNATEVPALAKQLGKSDASVRAKLSSMGLYVKAEKTKAAKGGKTTKADMAVFIGSKCNMNEVEVEALTKTTMAVLDKLAKTLE